MQRVCKIEYTVHTVNAKNVRHCNIKVVNIFAHLQYHPGCNLIVNVLQFLCPNANADTLFFLPLSPQLLSATAQVDMPLHLETQFFRFSSNILTNNVINHFNLRALLWGLRFIDWHQWGLLRHVIQRWSVVERTNNSVCEKRRPSRPPSLMNFGARCSAWSTSRVIVTPRAAISLSLSCMLCPL